MRNYDVLVIGASISGLTFSKLLLEKNNDVSLLILEEHENFELKACGEGIQDVNINGSTFFNLSGFKKGIEKHVPYGILHFPFFDLKIEYPIYTINKKKVERELEKKILRMRGEIEFNKRVEKISRVDNKIKIYPQNINAKILIGCDGFHSIVRKSIGERITNYGFGISANSDLTQDFYEIWFKRNIFGFNWIFPRKKDSIIGTSTYTNSKTTINEFKKFTKNFNITNVKGAFIPLQFPCKSYDDNIILVGDSCSQISSMTGGGMLSSIICAKIASKIVNKSLKMNKFDSAVLSKYEYLWKKELGEYFKKFYIAKNIGYIGTFTCLLPILCFFGKQYIKQHKNKFF